MFNCNIKKEKNQTINTKPSISANTTPLKQPKFIKLKKQYIVGQFDDDSKIDTIYEHLFSEVENKEIDSSLSPYENDWDTVVKWFYKQEAELFLVSNKKNIDTLHLGIAQGLYYFYNIGDINLDGKDEIALAIDFLDYSRLNSCKIYTICNNKWTNIKQFDIHEDAFNFTTDKPEIFKNIKDFLEKRNNKWYYSDYTNIMETGINKMEILKTDKCK